MDPMKNTPTVSTQEKEAVLRLDASKRSSYFIKRVADWESAWGLWQEGWALSAAVGEGHAFPLWPAREFADACAFDEWAGYEAVAITLDELLTELLPKLGRDEIAVALFPTPENRGGVVQAEQLALDLRKEAAQYE